MKTKPKEKRSGTVIIRPVDPAIRSRSFSLYGPATEPVLEEIRERLRAAVEQDSIKKIRRVRAELKQSLPTNTSGRE